MSRPIKAIFAGSFDPITNGHLDLIKRASKIFDELKVGILVNPNKKSLFTLDERKKIVNEVVKDIENVEVILFEGLLIDYCRKNGISVLVRGIRSSDDVNYELQMAHINRELDDEIETVILPTNVRYSFISSSLVKEALGFNADIHRLVPKCVLEELDKKNKSK